MLRVFFVLGILKRDIGQKIEAAPYHVYTNSDDGEVICIRKLDPTIFHFVSKGTDSWWFILTIA